MKSSNQKLNRIIALARRAAPKSDEPVSPDTIKFFSQSTATAWSRLRQRTAPSDPFRLWERVGAWSLATAAAIVLLAAALHPSAPKPNPFDPHGPDDTEETLFF